MTDATDKAAREKAWWDAWWAEDYSWAGLANKPVGENFGTIHGGLHGEKTLQDYWRRDPATGTERDDAALRAAGELIDCDGVLFHVAHLPPKARAGAPTWKADLKHADWDRLDALLATRIAAGAATKVDFKGDAEAPDGRAQFAGAVLRGAAAHPQGGESHVHLEASRSTWLGHVHLGRTRLGPGAVFNSAMFSTAIFRSATFSGLAMFDGVTFSGVVTFNGATFSGSARFPSATFSEAVNFEGAAFSGGALFRGATFCRLSVFDGATFSGGVSFDSTTFSGNARFNSATFSGDSGFDSATFSGSARFDRATFSGNARFVDAGFEGPAHFRVKAFEKQAWFDRCRFAQIVWFDGAAFRGDMDFTAAIFERLASFERIQWPDDARHWHSAFHHALFRGTLGLQTERGDGFRSFAAFDGATFERGIQMDDPSEANARMTFRKEVRAAIAASHADGDDWSIRETARRKEAEKDKARAVSRGEIAGYVRDAREARLKQLERGCRVLKQVMEKASNKSREQLLYRFELQARRIQRGLPLGEAMFSDLYALASDYGASMVRPFLALAVLIGAFTAIFLGWAWALGGVAEEGAYPSALQAFDLSWANVFKPLSALTAEGATGSALAKTLLGGDPLAASLVRVVATVESLFAIVLAFLFALAVRRRFQIS